MMEYLVYHKDRDEEMYIFGYTYVDACRRAKINPDEWVVHMSTFID